MILKRKISPNQKVKFFVHLNNFFLLNAKYQTQIVERPKLKQHQNIAKAISSPEHIYKHVEHQKKLMFGGQR